MMFTKSLHERTKSKIHYHGQKNNIRRKQKSFLQVIISTIMILLLLLLLLSLVINLLWFSSNQIKINSSNLHHGTSIRAAYDVFVGTHYSSANNEEVVVVGTTDDPKLSNDNNSNKKETNVNHNDDNKVDANKSLTTGTADKQVVAKKQVVAAAAAADDDDEEEDVLQKQQKPKLYVHVGPKKTGTTSIQMNVLNNEKIRDTYLSSDGYQTLGLPYLAFTSNLVKFCLKEDADPHFCVHWNYYVLDPVKKAHKKTVINSNIKATILSSEDLSALPKNNYTYSLLKQLFEDWDVSFIIMHRPLMDWLPSMYAQLRKYTIRDTKKDFDHYVSSKIPLLPEWISGMRNTFVLPNGYVNRDTLSVYEYYKDFLINFMDEPNPDSRIIIMQSNTPRGLERDFVCNLPHTNNSCEFIEGQTFHKQNESGNLPLDLDLILREAFAEGLISIARTTARKYLIDAMDAANITLSHLPKRCIYKEDEEWIWNRTLVSEQQFGSGTVSTNDLRKRFEGALQNKFCIIDAAATLRIPNVRGLFDDCKFQSPTLLNHVLRDFNPKKPNQKWRDLGCKKTSVERKRRRTN